MSQSFSVGPLITEQLQQSGTMVAEKVVVPSTNNTTMQTTTEKQINLRQEQAPEPLKYMLGIFFLIIIILDFDTRKTILHRYLSAGRGHG